MKLSPQSTGIDITKANTKITEPRSIYTSNFSGFHEIKLEAKLWQQSNFRLAIDGLPSSDCCLICRPWCRCCYAFSGFLLRT